MSEKLEALPVPRGGRSRPVAFASGALIGTLGGLIGPWWCGVLAAVAYQPIPLSRKSLVAQWYQRRFLADSKQATVS
jgi:hypothetical protein